MKIAKSPLPEKDEELPDVGEAQINRFVGFVNQGIEAWTKAGALLVQMVDRNPNTYKLIMAKSPHISVDLLLAFERIGRQKVYPYLLLEKSAGAQRLLNFPYAEQERIFHNPQIDFVLLVNGGKHITTRKSVFQLSANECDQATITDSYGCRFRTTDEQIHYLKVKQNGQSNEPGKSRGFQSARGAQNNNRQRNLKPVGTYQIVMGDDGPYLKQVSKSDYPFALPIEIIGGKESEPFELLKP